MPMNNKRKSIDELANSSKKMKLVGKPDMDSSIEEEEEECLSDQITQAIQNERNKKGNPSSARGKERDSDKEDCQVIIKNVVNEMKSQSSDISDEAIDIQESDEPLISTAESGSTIDESIVEVGEDDDGGVEEEEQIYESDSDEEDCQDFIEIDVSEMKSQSSDISDEKAIEPIISIAESDEAIVEVGTDDDDGGVVEEEKTEKESNSTENVPKYIRNTNRKVFEPEKFETIPIPPWLGHVRPKFVLKFARPNSFPSLKEPLVPKVLPAPALPAVTTKLVVVRRKTPAEREIQENHIESAPVKVVYVCEVCNKTYKSKAGFNNHQKQHNNDLQFPCEECEEKFTNQTILNTHVENKHSGKIFSCDFCGNVYKQINTLKNHIKTHTGEMPILECDDCGKTFRNKESLKKHQFTHTGEKKFECDICHKTFKQRSHLNTHRRTHFGEKPYRCNLCEHAYTQQSGLIQHKRRFH